MIARINDRPRSPDAFSVLTVLVLVMVVWVTPAESRRRGRSRHHPPNSKTADTEARASLPIPQDGLTCLKLSDGALIVVDEAWEDSRGIWYRKSGVTHLVPHERVSSIERHPRADETKAPTSDLEPAKVMSVESDANPANAHPVWIYLVGGARVEADDAVEQPAGTWYRRGTLSIFLARSRIERIEREQPLASLDARSSTHRPAKGWSTGNKAVDNLIKQNGSRYNVDPYLIFCVMEQESHFYARAVSPKGARGLMQLMPGTGARFGVRHPFSPNENIRGGTLYLKQLLQNFGGHVNLVLASYNAGEGTVVRYGGRVPPYRETRNYVKRISARYGQNRDAEKTPAVAVNSKLRSDSLKRENK